MKKAYVASPGTPKDETSVTKTATV